MTYFDMYWVGEGIHNLKILFGRTDWIKLLIPPREVVWTSVF
jgi:hypothetical protein